MGAEALIILLIAGITEQVKRVVWVNGLFTVAIALVVGVAIAIVDTSIGLVDITIAEGLTYAMGAIGGATLLSKTRK